MKYKLLENESKQIDDITVYRIQVLCDMDGMGMKAGDKGGWLECYDNLSQEGECMVCDEAAVYDEAVVLDNAKVADNAKIFNGAVIRDNALVCGNAQVYSDAVIKGLIAMYDNVQVYDRTIISGIGEIGGDVIIHGVINIESDDLFIYDQETANEYMK